MDDDILRNEIGVPGEGFGIQITQLLEGAWDCAGGLNNSDKWQCAILAEQHKQFTCEGTNVVKLAWGTKVLGMHTRKTLS